jgi:hypothetical protein
MQIVVQEGEGLISLVTPIQAPDESLRTTTVHSVTGSLKAYYRDHELIHVEARDGALEIMPAAVGAINWVTRGRRYQLKVGS